MLDRLTEIHNTSAALALRAIVGPTVEAGGRHTDILVVAESVLLGVVLFNERQFNVTRRQSAALAEALIEQLLTRLAGIPQEGSNG